MDVPRSVHFDVMKGKLETLIEKAEEGSPEDQFLIAILQLLMEQGAHLRTIEMLVGKLQEEISTRQGRGEHPTVERRKPQTAVEPGQIVRGKRWTDVCSFCGKVATEHDPLFSSPTGAHICTRCLDILNAMRGA